jgi:nucleotide-binding universal stress UspA family protein
MFHRILIAWDGSPSAEHAADVALDLARRYDADVTAASVAYSPAHAETEADRRESVDAARRYLEESLARIQDRAARAGVPFDTHVLEGDEPAGDLLRFAHEHGFDLIVAGRHTGGRGGRVLFGGLSDLLAASARRPVLIVGDENGHTR